MKIKAPNGILTVLVLTLLLIAAIRFVPWTPVRIILGLPLLLFFPGYCLLNALFTSKQMDGVERLAISGGMSIAIVALIGFALNFTIWGIRLEPALYSTSAFIFVTSIVALARQARTPAKKKLVTDLYLRLPGWKASDANKAALTVLVICIVAALGILGYASTVGRARGPFTEFYVLGIAGRAQDYPTGFTMSGGQVVSVTYGASGDVAGELGEVVLGIVNHEEQPETYYVNLWIDGIPAQFNYNGAIVDQIKGITLLRGEKWEQRLGFAPQQTGENQKVEFVLSKAGGSAVQDWLSLWINARAAAAP